MNSTPLLPVYNRFECLAIDDDSPLYTPSFEDAQVVPTPTSTLPIRKSRWE